MSYEDFEAFFRFKSCDVLTNGNYKKYVTQCKENADAWAIDLYTKQNRVQQLIKQLNNKLNMISKTKLGIACKHVSNCAQPPIKILIGFSKCFITGIQSDKCLDLSKNGKKNVEIHIHPKFAYFFLFLWYICKLEYVIRACSKNWHEAKNKQKEKTARTKSKGTDQINDELFDQFMGENSTLCFSLFKVFEKALVYVQSSLDLYDEEFTVKPMITPDASFWNQL
jgi:hypothetical protein